MPPTGQRTFSIYVTTDVPLTSGVEAVVATLGGITTWSPDNVVRLTGWVSLTTAAGATGTTLRFRRQSLTGTQVGESQLVSTAAATTFELVIDAEDTPGDVAGLPYVLTALVAGGNGTAITSEVTAVIG